MAQQDEKMIADTLEYLKSIPQMEHILGNLPDKITYKFSENTPGIASFDSQENVITIKPNSVDFNNPQERLSFYVTLAHELCHANQKKEGLYYNDLSKASFGDTFRIAKMMEAETRLFSAIIENELLKRKEFQSCIPSVDSLYYRSELQRANGNVSQANTNFVLSYWQNAKNNTWLNQVERDMINSRYFFYTEQAYHQALLIHDLKFNQLSTNRMSPIDAVRSYTQRMGLIGLAPELFLQEKFDNVQTTGDFKDGITILNYDGSKYLNLAPTDNPLFDKASFFKNNQIEKVFLRNGMTGEMQPYASQNGLQKRLLQCSEEVRDITSDIDRADSVSSQKSANLSALEIAIENRNMDRIRKIISEDPSVINRQHKHGKNFPLLMAIQNDNAEAVSFILRKNPNLLLNAEDGKNVLTELTKLSDTKLQRQIQTLFVAQKEALNKGPRY